MRTTYLSRLSESFETTLLTFEHHPDSADGHCGRAELEQLFPAIEVVTVPGLGPHKRLSQAASLPRRGYSWTWGRYRRPAMREAMLEIVARRRAAVVHLDELGVALWGPIPGTLSVYGSHNIDQRVIAAEADAAVGIRRLFARVDERKVAREEVEVWRRMPLCLAVSELDARTMRAGGARRVEVVPNGTDEVERLPMRYRDDNEPVRILFIGSGSYRPNERGIHWFVTDVLPQLRLHVPTKFEVVGKPPLQPLRDPDVTYVGTVPSVRPYYERAHVMVVPLFQGSGTRLKVVEALARTGGRVSTPLGAEGLGLSPGRHFLEARQPPASSKRSARLRTG